MQLKHKLAFYNFMIFLIIFDLIYIVVWAFSIQMNLLKAIVIAGLTVLMTPWAKASKRQSGRKVVIRSFAYNLYKKYHHRIRLRSHSKI
jgi:hypothetical protein